jgi:hypothetical protein
MPLSAKLAQSPSPDLLGAIPTPLIAHPLRNIDSPTSPPSSSRRPPVEPVPRPRLFVAHLLADPRECSRSSSRRDTSVRRSWRNGNHERLGHRGDLRDLGGELARIDGRGSGASSGSESHWRGKGYLPLFGGSVIRTRNGRITQRGQSGSPALSGSARDPRAGQSRFWSHDIPTRSGCCRWDTRCAWVAVQSQFDRGTAETKRGCANTVRA